MHARGMINYCSALLTGYSLDNKTLTKSCCVLTPDWAVSLLQARRDDGRTVDRIVSAAHRGVGLLPGLHQLHHS